MVSLVKKSTLLTALLINASSYAAADRTYTIKPYNTADHQVDICEIIEEHMPSLFPPSLPTDASWKAVLNKIESKHSSVAVICDEASSVVGFINYEASQVSEEEYWTQGFTETKLLPSELVEKIFPSLLDPQATAETYKALMKPMIPSETLEYLLKPQLQIHLVAVRSALIGTGLGKKLINHAFNDLKKRAVQYDGATHVSAAIPPHNVHAREVFEHLGFQKSKNPNTPFMEKPLKSFRIKF